MNKRLPLTASVLILATAATTGLAAGPASATASSVSYDVVDVGGAGTLIGCYGQLNAYWDSGTAYVQGYFSYYSSSDYCRGWVERSKNGANGPFARVTNVDAFSYGNDAATGWHWDGSNNSVMSRVCVEDSVGGVMCSNPW